jgi:hypothetical protein
LYNGMDMLRKSLVGKIHGTGRKKLVFVWRMKKFRTNGNL